MLEQNNSKFIGKVSKLPSFSHEVKGEKFYNMELETERISGVFDTIPLLISEKLLNNTEYVLNDIIEVDCQIRTYNQVEEEKSHLIIVAFVVHIEKITEENYELDKTKNNKVILKGNLWKNPIYRTTPLGKEIAYLFLAINRTYGRSDYIPCITWGRNAVFAKNSLKVGDFVEIEGRFQSRQYTKKFENGETIEKTAFEISIIDLKTKKEEGKKESDK